MGLACILKGSVNVLGTKILPFILKGGNKAIRYKGTSLHSKGRGT